MQKLTANFTIGEDNIMLKYLQKHKNTNDMPNFESLFPRDVMVIIFCYSDEWFP